VLYDAHGELLLARAYDLQSGEWMEPPLSLLEPLDPANPLSQVNTAPAAAKSGLLWLPEGALMLAAAPILPSSLENPPIGTLLIGRWLDEDYLADLSSLTGHPIELLPASSDLSELGWQPGLPTGDYWSRPLDEQSIDGFAAFEDIYGDRSLILRVRTHARFTRADWPVCAFLLTGWPRC